MSQTIASSPLLQPSSVDVVTRQEWLAARRALLAREKAFTAERDALSAARRNLPMVKVEKSYAFEEPSGTRTLRDLFDGKRQLIVYHFMFDPSWTAGCKGCSIVADHFTGAIAHLGARDTALVAASRAPVATLEAFKRRMGWSFRWVSSGASEFNYDYRVSFTPEEQQAKSIDYNYQTKAIAMSDLPGLSVFLRRGDGIFHTYSTYARGLDLLINAYNYLDLTPLGRQEEQLSPPMSWVRHHDDYTR